MASTGVIISSRDPLASDPGSEASEDVVSAREPCTCAVSTREPSTHAPAREPFTKILSAFGLRALCEHHFGSRSFNAHTMLLARTLPAYVSAREPLAHIAGAAVLRHVRTRGPSSGRVRRRECTSSGAYVLLEDACVVAHTPEDVRVRGPSSGRVCYAVESARPRERTPSSRTCVSLLTPTHTPEYVCTREGPVLGANTSPRAYFLGSVRPPQSSGACASSLRVRPDEISTPTPTPPVLSDESRRVSGGSRIPRVRPTKANSLHRAAPRPTDGAVALVRSRRGTVAPALLGTR